jgi:hypothetical protein
MNGINRMYIYRVLTFTVSRILRSNNIFAPNRTQLCKIRGDGGCVIFSLWKDDTGLVGEVDTDCLVQES